MLEALTESSVCAAYTCRDEGSVASGMYVRTFFLISLPNMLGIPSAYLLRQPIFSLAMEPKAFLVKYT